MKLSEQQAALIKLHDHLIDALGAVPNGTVHPSHVIGVLTDTLAYTIVDAAQLEHVDTITEEFATMLRSRVAHYAREASREQQGEFDYWPASQDRSQLQ